MTGHSLGGALSTLFTADVAEYGLDAGRALPQLEPSEPWWNSLASTFSGQKKPFGPPPLPPRPKSLKMYNFGSPRVGNAIFVANFESMMKDGSIDEAYRIVNGEDVVARNPRSMNGLMLGNINYDHCAPTVLISDDSTESNVLWIEGEDGSEACPVRDATATTSPLAKGNLLGDLISAVQDDTDTPKVSGDKQIFDMSKLGAIAGKVSGRLKNISTDDLASVVGIDKKFTQREMKMIQSLMSGAALSHHMEDQYYKGMGMSSGYVALVGEELKAIGSTTESMAVTDAVFPNDRDGGKA